METTDVVICGCGPTGAMLSAYLGQLGVQNIVLERELTITTDPRGIALDEDGIRLLQGVGIYDKIFNEIGQKMGYFNFIPGTSDLHATPFLRFNNNTIGGAGHPGFICHKQPVMEKCLRDQIAKFKSCEIRCGSTVQGITEDENWVYISYLSSSGATNRLRAKFLVGADGKTGFTRKKYLEPKGITMEKDSKFKYEEAWVALNWRITAPTRKTHPDFPLWQIGYEPEMVYDAFFPTDFRFICNPDRPSVCGRFGLSRDRLWRFEYVVKPGEDPMAMAEYENVKKVVYPYLTHPGKRYKYGGLVVRWHTAVNYYSLEEDVVFPEDCIEVVRSRPFNFSARSCNKWSLGRVILCGDSAHVFPPFGGQGIASGFRDANSLSWRLAIACRPGFVQYEPLLSAWYKERKQQLERSLAATIVNGNFCNERNKLKIFMRDWYLWLLQLRPSWKDWLELGQRQDGMTRYDYSLGMPFLQDLRGGVTLPQVFCRELGAMRSTRPVFTDDVIFDRKKSGLFQLVVLLDTKDDLPRASEELADLEHNSAGEMREDEVTYIISSPGEATETGVRIPAFKGKAFRVVFADDYDPSACQDLPEPIGYDGYRMKKEMSGRYVVVRPDRFVFAICQTKEELQRASWAVASVISGYEI